MDRWDTTISHLDTQLAREVSRGDCTAAFQALTALGISLGRRAAAAAQVSSREPPTEVPESILRAPYAKGQEAEIRSWWRGVVTTARVRRLEQRDLAPMGRSRLTRAFVARCVEEGWFASD